MISSFRFELYIFCALHHTSPHLRSITPPHWRFRVLPPRPPELHSTVCVCVSFFALCLLLTPSHCVCCSPLRTPDVLLGLLTTNEPTTTPAPRVRRPACALRGCTHHCVFGQQVRVRGRELGWRRRSQQGVQREGGFGDEWRLLRGRCEHPAVFKHPAGYVLAFGLHKLAGVFVLPCQRRQGESREGHGDVACA